MPKEYSPDQRRVLTEQIYNQISLHGIKSYSMDQLAKDLQVSKKTVYKYYQNKETLIKSMMNQFTDELLHVELPKPVSFGDVSQTIHLAIQQAIKISRTFADGFVEELHEVYPSIYDDYQRNLDQFYKLIIDWLNEAAELGVTAKVDNEVVALIPPTMLPVFRRFYSEEDFDKHVENFEKLVIKMLKP
ncbi:TetR/AcrR family transcriptional regulator [Lentilactobacillus kosonis]|uniref:HTH tetR-type domain-containing protein n=1 Tax=Lentilactobacillus kosonis TaxID=2810561 RepID=A0A401FHP3_9LACO|nr:TetR/AcrR family transcriptional regulator [Lentilactobacillus kosonis]GAY71885.1 hypothetical protein NBRC111893_31 [Lentilactobacillus kosonis]